MGSKPSRTKAKVVVAEGVTAATLPPAQETTSSAPPTPGHPEGAPRHLDGVSPPSGDEATGSQDGGGIAQAAATYQDSWHSSPQSSSKNTTMDSPAVNDEKPLEKSPSSPPTLSTPSPKGRGRVGEAAAPPDEAATASGDRQPCFGLPLEEVLAQAHEAFGPVAASLSSTKWDRRVQAFKGVGAALKGFSIKGNNSSLPTSGDAGDHAKSFRAACLLLHIALKDKVLPVLFAAHELYRIVFEHGAAGVSNDEASYAMSMLLQHVLPKLGELNIRVHESACACIVFSAQRPFFGLASVLRRLHTHAEEQGGARGQTRMRTHAGVLDVTTQLLRHFPGRREGEGDNEADAVSTWTPSDIAPFIASGIAVDGVVGVRVQQAAVGLTVAVCHILGKSAVDPIVAGLSPAGQELLRGMLEDEEPPDDFDDDDEDGDGDVIEFTGNDAFGICGVGLKPTGKDAQTEREDCLMDDILEETGLVFEGKGLQTLAPSHNAIDDELRGLGLDCCLEEDGSVDFPAVKPGRHSGPAGAGGYAGGSDTKLLF
eukprot:gnl/TRDRNA2_/TRDRNA2_43141_c0_seq1.p1 gnl/TRDRNA2_/TRDRNA2_43141_c0~~gnl/TRDRNA2_/TRDRNA2_43141_c0_seq1.p1  ORF type:complete len:540 (-),score=101.55 gnl/TRDRNA2_/TRDRNA2_43141_c0_seq1:81-1700(-)